MSVKDSPPWVWLPNMQGKSEDGSLFTVLPAPAEDPDGNDFELEDGTVWGIWHDDDYPEIIYADKHEPDLDDPATQGAIVYGIFEPMGIGIMVSWGGCRLADGYRVVFAYNGACKDLGPDIKAQYFACKADVIPAVFNVIASEAKRNA